MCDECKNIDLEQEEFANEQENQEQLVDVSSDERFVELEIEKDLLRLDREIIYDDESLAEMINSDKFQEGCDDASYYCGFYTSLINAGMTSKFAEDCVMNKMTIDHNIQSGDMANKTSIAISKNQSVQVDKAQV